MRVRSLVPALPTLFPALFCSVIKIILQFCKENSLLESFNAIQVRGRAASPLPPLPLPLEPPKSALLKSELHLLACAAWTRVTLPAE